MPNAARTSLRSTLIPSGSDERSRTAVTSGGRLKSIDTLGSLARGAVILSDVAEIYRELSAQAQALRIVSPPSTTSTAPVTNEAAGSASESTMWAISSGSP